MPVVTDYTALLSGNYWNGIEVTQAPVIVTFSFPTSAPSYDSSVDGFTAATPGTFQTFTTQEQTEALQALGEWSAASGLVFVEVAPGQGDINFQNVDLSTTSYSGAGGVGFYPFGDWSYLSYPYYTSDLTASGDVFMNSQDIGTDGSVNYGTLLHEIGHAIGLKHPTEVVTDNAANPAVVHDQVLSSDDPDLTIMAEVEDQTTGADSHLQTLDMQAAAYLYGPAGTGGVYTGSATGSNSVSSWSWDASTETLTQTALQTNEAVRGTSVNDVIHGLAGDQLFGLDGNDTLYGAGGGDKLYGGPGTDLLVGGGGDTFYVDSATTTVVESVDDPSNTVDATVSFALPDNIHSLQVYGEGLTAQGNDGGDTLYGDGTYATDLIGGAGSDYIAGGTGNDTITGGSGGDDLMYGGGGDNQFVFTSLNEIPLGDYLTIVGDFVSGQDTIDLSAITTTGTDPGQPLSFIGTSAFSDQAGQVRDFNDGTNTFVQGDLNGDGTADFEITLYGLPALQANDFTFSPACYCLGTRILTERGEVAVEDLSIGDRLMTPSGAIRPIKWIGCRSYAGWLAAGNPKVLPVTFRPGALADKVPLHALSVSPEHAMLIDGNLVPAGLLVNGRSITKAQSMDVVQYFHIELESHDVILAEGAWSETFFDDGGRGVFQNAADYYALYPAHDPAREQAYCAPRMEDGFALEILRASLAGRAERLRADGTVPEMRLEGCHDPSRPGYVSGWARDVLAPKRHVPVAILCDGVIIAQVTADRLRPGLRLKGKGDGYNAFDVALPSGFSCDRRHEIEVRFLDDWSLMDGSPRVIEPTAGSRPAAVVDAAALRGAIDVADRLRIKGWAQDQAEPERAVSLLILANDAAIGRVLANTYREDLGHAGIGDGRHAFEFILPADLACAEAVTLRVVRAIDGADIPGSPAMLTSEAPGLSDVEAVLAKAVDAVTAAEDQDRMLALLTHRTEQLLTRRAARSARQDERESLRAFRRRWGSDVTPDALADSGPRALVIDEQVPVADRDGGSVAILSHIRALRTLGYAVTFLAWAEMDQIAALVDLEQREQIATCGRPHYACVEDVLSRQASGFDLVYLHRVATADRYLPLVRAHLPRARVVFSVADLHHLRLARQAQIESRPNLLALARTLEHSEFSAAARADLVLTHSPVEAALLKQRIPAHKVLTVPFAVTNRRDVRGFQERRDIAFLGSFSHGPNPDAAFWLVREIMPRVWARDPSIRCRIAGHGWAAGHLGALDPRVDLVGHVPNLDSLFGDVRLSVAPLRFGAGLKGKVLDSFAAGLPCVMTPVAAEGLPLSDTLADLVADGAEAMADRIIRLHHDAALNQSLGEQVRRLVADQFSQVLVDAGLRTALGIRDAMAATR